MYKFLIKLAYNLRYFMRQQHLHTHHCNILNNPTLYVTSRQSSKLRRYTYNSKIQKALLNYQDRNAMFRVRYVALGVIQIFLEHILINIHVAIDRN